MMQSSNATLERSTPQTRSSGPLLQRKCGCGKHTPGGGQCGECSKQNANGPEKLRVAGTATGQTVSAESTNPYRRLEQSSEVTDEERPNPFQSGDATIQCDGSGGYRVLLNGFSGATCGTEKCVTAHENSHIVDWKSKWPSGCVGQPASYLPKGDPPDTPLLTVAEYNEFRRASECRAHTVDLQCAKALPQTGACAATVQSYIESTERERAKHCPSTLTNVLIGAGAGAAIGGVAGGLIGGPIGAAIGGGLGAVVGGIGGLLF